MTGKPCAARGNTRADTYRMGSNRRAQTVGLGRRDRLVSAADPAKQNSDASQASRSPTVVNRTHPRRQCAAPHAVTHTAPWLVRR